MNSAFPIVLAAHAETAWSITGQYMGARDLPLTERGERNALRLRERLRGLTFVRVLTGPFLCVRRTCELAGYGSLSEVDNNLMDWDYGAYEGREPAEIVQERPGWDLFRDGCPGGESPVAVAERARRVVDQLRCVNGSVLIFSSAHFLQVLAAGWISLENPSWGARFALSPGSLSALGYDGTFDHPAIRLWNDVHHVGG